MLILHLVQSYHYMKKHQAQLCRAWGETSRLRSLHLSHSACQAMTTDNIFHPAEWCCQCLFEVQRGQGELVLDQDKLIKEEETRTNKNYREKSKNSEAFTNICWMGERYYSFPLEVLLESLQMTLLSKGKSKGDRTRRKAVSRGTLSCAGV